MRRFAVFDLLSLVQALFEAAGLSPDRATAVAEILVEGDLMGRSTHGVQLVTRHLGGIKSGAIACSGEPLVLSDHGAALTWDGLYLPGPWLVRCAMEVAFERLSRLPVVTVVIRRSGHIGCLGAYPRFAAEKNLMMLLASSDPSVAIVAPHGSVQRRITPNPIAAGWPTDGDPVIIDTCPSTTTGGMVNRMKASGVQFSQPWLIGRDGKPSCDPSVMMANGDGAILPLGGLDLGHKGFALGLIVEALTAALGGYGRADGVKQDGAAVFLQLIDPNAFGGIVEFRRETEWLTRSCQSATPIPGGDAVRMPGARSLALRREQMVRGVVLHPDAVAALAKACSELGLEMPIPRGE